MTPVTDVISLITAVSLLITTLQLPANLDADLRGFLAVGTVTCPRPLFILGINSVQAFVAASLITQRVKFTHTSRMLCELVMESHASVAST